MADLVDAAPKLSSSQKERRRKLRACERRDGPGCYWCGRWLELDEQTLDHVIQRSKGGTNAIANLRIACGPCNAKRGGVHRAGGFLEPGTPSRLGATSVDELIEIWHIDLHGPGPVHEWLGMTPEEYASWLTPS